jgi:hypothetical protein
MSKNKTQKAAISTKVEDNKPNPPIYKAKTLGDIAREKQESMPTSETLCNDLKHFLQGVRYEKPQFEEKVRGFFAGKVVEFHYMNPNQCYITVDGIKLATHIQLGR